MHYDNALRLGPWNCKCLLGCGGTQDLFKNQTAIFILTTGAILASGCATKKYVKQSVDPVSQRVDQVATQSNQQGQTLEATRKDVDKNAQDISATRETARAADARAGDAMNAAAQAGSKADQANAKADQNSRALNDLRSTVANLEDYKPATNVVIPFKFGKDTLGPDAKAELDHLAQGKDQWKRYFIAVEGFTDKVGSSEYNDALSRRRAERVVQYLVATYDIPVYRIHEIGLGKDKPIDEGHNRQSRAKNRRVEVTVYTADSSMASAAQPGN